MIDISKIDRELLPELRDAYIHATYTFGIDPADASVKKQRKIRKWITVRYKELLLELSGKTGLLSSDCCDKEVLLFLKECSEEVKRIEKERSDKFEADFAALGEVKKAAFEQLKALDFWPDIKLIHNDAQIITDDTPAYRRILLLKNAGGVPSERQGYYCRDLRLIYKNEENKYCLCGELLDPIEESSEPIMLSFTDAEVTVEVYNSCGNVTFGENPWDFLQAVSFSIDMKSKLPGDYCNDKEKELLPLLREIVNLKYRMDLPEQEYLSFGELKRLAERYGYQKVSRVLTKLETVKPRDADFYVAVKKLTSVLCECKHAPMWRELYDKIERSQADYPNKVEALCDNKLLAEVREDVQRLMDSRGYIGTYPNFVKAGEIKGVRLAQSYNMTYFVYMEKRAQYHIHCSEALEENDYLTIQFLCGTALLKKDEEPDDVYGCLFNAKGRRLFHTVPHYIPLQNDDNAKKDDLETGVNIAVKKAECRKLNKQEQKEYYGKLLPGWGVFWWIFLVAGGMFGIAMTLIAMVFCILVTLALGMFYDIPEMLSAIPWGWLLAFSWIAFGGAMGTLEVLARRK